jgi:NAD(P)-dependent dehydrogenase (short-subunit alcohol dehydrogenase family)
VHVLCNNAGVGGPHGLLWEIAPGDIEWVLGVNTGGVLNGIRSFVPVLLEQDAAHVVNTASIFGVFAGTMGIYGPSEHTVVALSEALHLQLREVGARPGAACGDHRRDPAAAAAGLTGPPVQSATGGNAAWMRACRSAAGGSHSAWVGR